MNTNSSSIPFCLAAFGIAAVLHTPLHAQTRDATASTNAAGQKGAASLTAKPSEQRTMASDYLLELRGVEGETSRQSAGRTPHGKEPASKPQNRAAYIKFDGIDGKVTQ